MPAPRLPFPNSAGSMSTTRSNSRPFECSGVSVRTRDLTWLNLVSRGCVLDGIDGGSGVGVEGCSGVEEVVAGLDGDAAVVAQCRHEFLDRPAGLAFEPVADS